MYTDLRAGKNNVNQIYAPNRVSTFRLFALASSAALTLPVYDNVLALPLFSVASYTAPEDFISAISSSLYPSISLRISSVCSPNNGERLTSTSVSDSFIGQPTVR